MSDALSAVFGDMDPAPIPPPRRAALGSVRPINATAPPAEAFEPLPAIPFEWVGESNGTEIHAPRQIVEGVLTEGSLSVWYGDSNSGKTYLAMYLGYCVSLGRTWLGKRTEQGVVVLIAAEGVYSSRSRLVGFEKHYGEPPGAFGLIPAALNLMDPSVDVENLIDLLQQKVFDDECGMISLIIVDTVARVMGGANENASEDMGRLVAACDQIRRRTGAHVLLIHHSGKDAAKGARGHSSLRAAVDTEIEVTADESTHTHTAKITKQRDLASKGERIAGRFVSVELGRDQWDNPITVCAIEPADADDAPIPMARLPRGQAAVLGYLAGQQSGMRRADVVAVLTLQGFDRASVYRAINALIKSERVTDTMGLLYVPK